MPPAKPTPEAKPTKTLTAGIVIGRAINKLTEINEGEARELADYPENVKAKYAKRRAELLSGLDPAIKAAVLGAVTAKGTEAAAE